MKIVNINGIALWKTNFNSETINYTLSQFTLIILGLIAAALLYTDIWSRNLTLEGFLGYCMLMHWPDDHAQATPWYTMQFIKSCMYVCSSKPQVLRLAMNNFIFLDSGFELCINDFEWLHFFEVHSLVSSLMGY